MDGSRSRITPVSAATLALEIDSRSPNMRVRFASASG
jgi:hypothetical protein